MLKLLEESRQFSKEDGRPNERWEIVRTVAGYSIACKYELVDTFYSVGYFVKCDNCGHVTIFDTPDSEHLGNDVCVFCYTKLYERHK